MNAANGLSSEEISHFVDKGFCGPFTLCPRDEMAPAREEVLRLAKTPHPYPTVPAQSRHFDSRLIYDLCAHPEICSRVASLLGPDLLLWRSQLFVKQPGEPAFHWHQDVAYFHMLEPPINVSAWIAIADATAENGCVQVIPGSHKRLFTHQANERTLGGKIKRRLGIHVDYELHAKVPAAVKKHAIPVELEAGQFFLFNERLLHSSGPNRTQGPRIGVASRITTTRARIEHDKVFKGHKGMLIHGEDSTGFNEIADPPS